jgi:hypothetical protein
MAAIFSGSIWILTAGFCCPSTLTWATPEIWLMFCTRMFSAASSTASIGSASE